MIKKLLVLSLMSLSLFSVHAFADAQHATLTLNGTITSSVKIDIDSGPAATYAVDMENAESNLPVGMVGVFSNSPTGYNISMASQWGGQLQGQDAGLNDQDFLPYKISIDGQPAQSLLTAPTVMLQTANPAPFENSLAAGPDAKHPLTVSHAAEVGLRAGAYQDVVTLAIAANI